MFRWYDASPLFMLTLRNVTKAFNNRVLFKDANMTINYGERVALVGPNGAGKSTLFSLILKTDTPDSGEIVRDEWTTLGYLPQESEPIGERDHSRRGHRQGGRDRAAGDAAEGIREQGGCGVRNTSRPMRSMTR